MTTLSISLAQKLSLPKNKVEAALRLFDEGATVPFIARYRKEVTGGLDEVELRAIGESKNAWVELEQRRTSILETLSKEGVLTPELRQAIQNAPSKTLLEDLYAPHKKRRKTRADKAREKGLGPLAERIQRQARDGNPRQDARAFVQPHKGVESIEEAIAGAQDIVAESLGLDPTLRASVRSMLQQHGKVHSKLAKKGVDGSAFRDYLDYEERADKIPSHRYLAVCRGEATGILSVSLRSDPERTLQQLLRKCRYFPQSPYGPLFFEAAQDALKRILAPAAERSVRSDLKSFSDDDAIDVFQKNLEAVLLAAPLGAVSVLGIDPGIRTGAKCAMIDAHGALQEYQTLFLVGRKDPQMEALKKLLAKHRPGAVAVGNGTAGRETEALVRTAVSELSFDSIVVSVSETGASIYSASDLAREELPQVDLTVRGAVSIARRLQDPLAELVKVPCQSIGVGQYQHDVDGTKLDRRLGQVVESCVNRVGVNLNTASPALLAYVAGIGPKIAGALVSHRKAMGGFPSRAALLDVPGLGKKTFEQCAGFLRVVNGRNPLDASAVHPERYALVKRMARDLSLPVQDLIGEGTKLESLCIQKYASDTVGEETLNDILAELKKPGRDPRSSFEAPAFRDDVHAIGDLEMGMVLEGVVTNVTNFGAFVDIGVHQDGLVHVSELVNRFIRDPHEVVQAGARIQVKVIEVDVGRKRISLSAKQVE